MAAVGGLDPSVLVAPDYQTQMLQAQRKLALAQALQEESLKDTPGNGGAVSWTQGLARIADALAGNAAARKGYQQMQGANQGYAAGMARLFGLGGPQTPQGAPPAASGPQTPAPSQNAPQQAPLADNAAIAATAQGQPVAPPQAAPPQPSANPSPVPMGGASSPMSLTGDPQRDMALYMMNPDEYTKALAGVAAKSATPNDLEVTLAHAREAMARGDVATASALLQNAQKTNYMEPINVRQGGVALDPVTHQPLFQAPKIGEGQAVIYGPDGHPQQVYNIPGAVQAASQQAAGVAGAQAGAKTPFETIQGFQNGQPVVMPKSAVTGGILNGIYHPGGGAVASGPALGQSEAFGTYGKNSANAFNEAQGIASSSPQRVQSLREMESLISGPNALNTGPTAAAVQKAAEEHGLTFLAKDNAFVFNKDAARFVAQSAQDLGLNGSDQRLGMMANASPNMKMTPQALKTVIPTMIGLEYAKMAKATAASTWAQRDPAGNAKFESTWRQNYDPRMFTAYAQGGPQALAKAPANLRQQWLRDYRNLKTMGVDFGQFAQ